MKSRKLVFLCLILWSTFSHFIQADEISSHSELSKKYNLSICAIFKNEAENLQEWIDYHRKIGVDHFYLYNMKSQDAFRRILESYIKEGSVTLVNWPLTLSDNENWIEASQWALSAQVTAYENAVNFLAQEDTKWLVLMDVNEFLICQTKDLSALLERYDDFSGITLPSLLFDTTLVNDSSAETQCAKSLSLGSPKENSVAKMIFKPEDCMGFTWPPYQCCFKPSCFSTEVAHDELHINRFINRNQKQRPIVNKHNFTASLNYAALSIEECVEQLKKLEASKTQHLPLYPETPAFLKKLIEK